MADRSNKRIQSFDKNMDVVDEWRQFGRPSGIWTLKDGDIIYYFLDPVTYLEIRKEVQEFVRGAVNETVIDLGAVFGAMSSLHAGDGLKLSVLSNTNSGLVRTDLSEAALTLTYVRGKCGTATIIVSATDADGVSAQLTIQVTVRPLGTMGTVSVSPTRAGTPVSLTPGMPR